MDTVGRREQAARAESNPWAFTLTGPKVLRYTATAPRWLKHHVLFFQIQMLAGNTQTCLAYNNVSLESIADVLRRSMRVLISLFF